ncbi:MAG: hypothetical protein LKM33_02655 [Bacteroidales bacterium]|nr:hypothetical protein [Bacteroidales bacterium]
MKLINITKSLAAVLLSVGMIMTSCSTDWPSYSPTSGDVTFQASSQVHFLYPELLLLLRYREVQPLLQSLCPLL